MFPVAACARGLGLDWRPQVHGPGSAAPSFWWRPDWPATACPSGAFCPRRPVPTHIMRTWARNFAQLVA